MTRGGRTDGESDHPELPIRVDDGWETESVTLDDLNRMIGGTLLVRITYVNADTVRHVAEFAGVVTSVDPLVTIERGENSSFTLPPDPEAFEVGKPGKYHLHSTDEVVVNPDFTSIWTVQESRRKRRRK
jgi:hypothetical protein